MVESLVERYAYALYRVSVSVDPVVLLWTATFVLATTYFVVSKLAEPFLSSSSRNTSGGRGITRGEGEDGRGARSYDAMKKGGLHGAEDVIPIRAELRDLYENAKKTLGNVRRVTLSTCGVLFQEKDCGELRKSATLLPQAKDLIEVISHFADVYLMTQVLDDVSMKNVTRTLIDNEITSETINGKTSNGDTALVQNHKVLYCEKHVSKVSIARQIEPDLHIDGDVATIQELQRFLPKVLFVTGGSKMDNGGQGGQGYEGAHKSNVLVTDTLHSFCTNTSSNTTSS